MTSDKETIYAALWAVLTGSVTGTVTSSRKVRHYDELQPQEQPAMFMEQTTVTTEGIAGHPAKQRPQAKILIYCFDDTDVGPMPAINGLVQQVENALKDPYTSTLSGNVVSARATNIEFGGGNLGAQGVGIVTIDILTTA